MISIGLVTLGAWWILGSADDGEVSSSASGPGAAGPEDVPAGHVHAVVADPKDGSVLVATHGGLFRVVDGELDRVGESYRDVMGLSVGRDDSLLASGHPDVAGMRAGEPGQLGMGERAARTAGRAAAGAVPGGQAVAAEGVHRASIAEGRGRREGDVRARTSGQRIDSK